MGDSNSSMSNVEPLWTLAVFYTSSNLEEQAWGLDDGAPHGGSLSMLILSVAVYGSLRPHR